MKKNFLKILICVVSFSCLPTNHAMRKASRETEYKSEYALVRQCARVGWCTVSDVSRFCGCIDYFPRSKPTEKKLIQKMVNTAYNVTKERVQNNDDLLLSYLYLGSLGYPETPARKEFKKLKINFLAERNIGTDEEELFIARHVWNIQKLAMQELFLKYGKVEDKCENNFHLSLLDNCFLIFKNQDLNFIKQEIFPLMKSCCYQIPSCMKNEVK